MPWCCPERIPYAHLFTMKCRAQHVAGIGQPPKRHCSLLPGVLPPPLHMGVEVLSRWLGSEGSCIFGTTWPSDVMVGGWLFCLLVVFLIVLVIVTRGFVGLLSWMQRQGNSAKCERISCRFCSGFV